ncbi:phenylalanyl-tRNA synthetase [Pelomyxa schiedti]|nr:phenylalanyl-tRNA synthetase [Pelomyxa schiedti]
MPKKTSAAQQETTPPTNTTTATSCTTPTASSKSKSNKNKTSNEVTRPKSTKPVPPKEDEAEGASSEFTTVVGGRVSHARGKKGRGPRGGPNNSNSNNPLLVSASALDSNADYHDEDDGRGGGGGGSSSSTNRTVSRGPPGGTKPGRGADPDPRPAEFRTEDPEHWTEILEVCARGGRTLRISDSRSEAQQLLLQRAARQPGRPAMSGKNKPGAPRGRGGPLESAAAAAAAAEPGPELVVNRLFPALFAPLQHLDTLEIVGCPNVTEFPQRIAAALPNLHNLTVSQTSVSAMPEDICNLPLVSLILDRNCLSKLPGFIGKLSSLQVLNISNNSITQFPPSLSYLANLLTLNANNNQLQKFPASLSSLKRLSTLLLSHNNIEEIACNLSGLESIQNINLSNNMLRELPCDLLWCEKRLHSIELRGNPFTDKKFVRIVDTEGGQNVTHLVMNYLHKNDSRIVVAPEKEPEKPPRIWLQRPGVKNSVEAHSAHITDAATRTRGFLVLAEFLQLQFTEPLFEQFINLQTDLHMSMCNKRHSAAIGTHDLDKIKSPFCLDARPPDLIKFVPLFQTKAVTGNKLRQKFEEAHDLSMLKYFKIHGDNNLWPVFIDSQNTVLSLPPVINSEHSKITLETTSILVEVSSQVSLDVCKEVLLQLIQEFSQILEQEGQQLIVIAVPVTCQENTVKFPTPAAIQGLLH